MPTMGTAMQGGSTWEEGTESCRRLPVKGQCRVKAR